MPNLSARMFSSTPIRKPIFSHCARAGREETAQARALSRLYNLIVYPKYPDKIKSPDDVLDDVVRRRSRNVCNRVTLEERRAGNIIYNREVPPAGNPEN